ncbi:iron-sulfur cluster co-chaperone protein HscB, mitochondrial [Copidosoma floridanum]|uniref:iron-sulfur cluster co-chaperone protein HscB, mitochondrial n=1 Tax=Copidosoma floridanum TaxID=29053 RepID=UPI0006C9A974|nr:iron-sulfur cluster co-chaperone protein HscB, mitochondrial [Copidosoma floridanum]
MYSQMIRASSIVWRKYFVYSIANASQRLKIQSLAKQPRKVTPWIAQQECLSHGSDCPPKCWQCDFPHKSELFCSKCKALQKLPKDLNYFDIIGVKKDFDIVTDEVQKKYRQLQNLLHPDKFGQKSDKEKEISENLSALVNKAYSILISPLDRGLYMLKLHNVSIPEETTSLEPEFLMEIMENNEQVEEAAEDKEKALELLKKNREILDSLIKQISTSFREENIDEAKKLLIKMKYYISIESRLKILKQTLGIVE